MRPATGHGHRIVPCPTCGREWPHPRVETRTPDALIDWTCPICLHAEIERLQRLLAEKAEKAARP